MVEYALGLDGLSHYTATEKKTVILVGRSGSGKSATGNSIIEDHVFDKMNNTTNIHQGATFLANGQILTVIDTPGAFDISVEPEIIGMETNIHAVLFVVSLKTESLVTESLTRFFGAKLSEYMIVVFTHGDVLEDMTLEQYLCHGCPEQLKKTLEMCGNRFVVFDNVTDDKLKKSHQREALLRLVYEVVEENGGVPYTNELSVELKEGQRETSDQHTEVVSSEISENGLKSNKAYEDQLLEMELTHREMTQMLEMKLKDEQFARIQAEAAHMKSNHEISRVREDLKRAQIEARKLRKTQRETKDLLKKKSREKMDEENQKKNNCAYYLITSAIEHQIESKLSLRLENQIAEKFGRMQAEEKVEWKSNDEIRKLREDIERAQRYTEDSFKKIELRMCDENLKKTEHQIESKLSQRLENQLADKFGRMQAEDKAERKSNDEIKTLREDVERIQKYTNDIFNELIRDQENQRKNEHQIESRLNQKLENLLADKFCRMQAEDEVERKSNDEIRKMREYCERIQRETHDIFYKMMRDQENLKKNEHQILLEKKLADEQEFQNDEEKLRNNRLTDSETLKQDKTHKLAGRLRRFREQRTNFIRCLRSLATLLIIFALAILLR